MVPRHQSDLDLRLSLEKGKAEASTWKRQLQNYQSRHQSPFLGLQCLFSSHRNNVKRTGLPKHVDASFVPLKAKKHGWHWRS